MQNDIYGLAIRDYYQNKFTPPLLLNNSYGEPEKMPIEVFFREDEDLSTLEHLALIECRGKVLDLGAGTGVHSLILQSRGIEAFALEKSAGCIEVMTQSGVQNVIHQDFKKHNRQYDTLLILMNGLGLAGKLKLLPEFLTNLKKLLLPGGQIIVDSSDISYLYESGKPSNKYFGEVSYQYEYRHKKGDWFDWLYVDQKTLIDYTSQVDLKCEILITDDSDQYLALLS